MRNAMFNNARPRHSEGSAAVFFFIARIIAIGSLAS